MTQAWRHRLGDVRKQTAGWWSGRTPREQTLMQVLASFTILWLTWSLGLKPALDTISRARTELPTLHAAAAEIEAYIIEARNLQHRQTGKVNATGLHEGLQASLRRAGLSATITPLKAHELPSDFIQQWTAEFHVVNAERVMEWLASLAHLLQLQTVEVTLTRSNVEGRDRPGYVSGRVLLGLPASSTP